MTDPSVLPSFAAAVYDRLGPIADQDEDLDYALASFIAGLGEMFQKIEDYSRDQDLIDGTTAPGWSQLVDVNRCPDEALPWLAQFVGTVINGNLDAADQRTQVVQAQNWKRGSVAALKNAALPYLTGNKTVIFSERDSGASPTDPAYGLTIYTRISETLDENAVLLALLAVKPGGIILNYRTVAGQVYEDIFLNDATYGAVFSNFDTYASVDLGINIAGPSPGGASTYGQAIYGVDTYGG